MTGLNTRAQAAAILQRVKDHGAYSNVVLGTATRHLSQIDRNFVYRLVTGALRRMRTIDVIIERTAGRSVADMDPEVVCVLEVGVEELLDPVADTAYATVNESVNAVKQLGFPQASGLINGLLRRLAREGMPDLPKDGAREYSVPEWVLGTLTADHGRQLARDLLTGLRRGAPAIGIRVRPGGRVPQGAEPAEGIPDAYTLQERPGSLDGVVVSDPASTAVARALGAHPKELILDMAAAPGGKTSALWDAAHGEADVVAMDAHRRRLLSARSRLEEIGIRPRWVLADGERTPFPDGIFDAVLVDAPCTGLGTLRRRPEIAMRLTPKGTEQLAARQAALLAEAWRITRSGGRIVYSVCTLFAAETIDVVAAYPARPPAGLPGVEWGAGVLLAPHLTGTDGMFVSIIERPE